jgi:acyl-CoA thioester hydrolase
MCKKFTFTIPIRFRDLDAMGHVNNATILTYFEEGRKEFFVHALQSISPKDFPFILAEVTCRYIRPIELVDKIVRENVWISRIGTKSFTFAYEIFRNNDPAWIFSSGNSVQVYYDYENRRSVQIPETFKSKVSPYCEGI